MSYTMTYDSLLVDMRRYLERGFTQASDQIVFDQLPRLITLAERRIARELKIEGFIRAVTTPLAVGVATYLKPDRWRDTVSMTVGGSSIFTRSYEYCRNYWPNEYAPEVLLYASLLEATPFLKNDERVQMWQALYDRSAQALNGQDLGRILDRSAQRSES